MADTNKAGDGFLIGAGQTLVCLGDSITQNATGYCATLAALIGAAYPDRNIRVINAGVSGHKAPDMRARLERDVLAHKPDWVTVNVGINDVWHGLSGWGSGGVSLADYRADVEEIVDRITASGARVVLLPPTVIGEDPQSDGNRRLQDYRAAMRAIGNARGLLIADTDTDFDASLASLGKGTLAQPMGVLGEPGKTLTTDGVHLRGPGDAVVAVAVLKALRFFS